MDNPSLRFTPMQGGNYPNWKTVSLSDVCDISAAGDIDQEKFSKIKTEDFQYPVYSNALTNSGLYGYYTSFQYDGLCVTITARGDIGHAQERDHKFHPIGRLLTLHNLKVHYKLLTEVINTQIKFHIETTGVPQLTAVSARLYEISIPTDSEEQEKIADFFTALDEKITLINAQLSQLNLYKQAQLQGIFSPENTENWGAVALSEVADIKTGGTPSTVVDEYWGGEILWMNSGEVNLRRVYDTQGRITKLGLEKSSTRLIPPNSVLIALAGQGKTRGTVAINKVELCVNQSIGAILPKSNLNYEYVYYNLFFRYQELRTISSGDGARGGLNLKILNDIIIPLPSLEEQAKIADYLSALDDKITNTQESLEQIKSYKLAMLQKMIT